MDLRKPTNPFQKPASVPSAPAANGLPAVQTPGVPQASGMPQAPGMPPAPKVPGFGGAAPGGSAASMGVPPPPLTSTKRFDAPSAFFQAPKDWTDSSSYILAAPPSEGGRATLVVNRVPELPEGETFDGFVEKQVADLKKLPQAIIISRRAEPLGSLKSVIVDFEWYKDRQTIIRQRARFVSVIRQVYTMTITAPRASFDQSAQAMEGVIATFEPRMWLA